MYFGYGWPKIYSASCGKDEEWLFLQQDSQYLVAVSASTVQLWSAGLNKVRLSQCIRSAADVAAEGSNTAAFWCPGKATLAVVTSNNYLHLYSVHAWKDTLLPGSGIVARDIPRVELYLRSTNKIECSSRCTAVTGDGRLILLGFEDGTLATCSWQGKLRETSAPFAEDELEARAESPQHLQQHQNVFEGAMSMGNGFSMPAAASIASMQYCEKSRMLVAVMQNGSCALYGPCFTGLSQLAELGFSHWVCSPQRQATCARIGACAQQIAVGCANGEVALYRLHRTNFGNNGADQHSNGQLDTPVRILSLDAWGHKVQQTGAIGRVEWAPDCRALAVGYVHQGLVVWSASGCRLLCSLRQAHGLNSQFSGNITGQLSMALSGALEAELGGTLEAGIVALAWGHQGYQLVAAEAGNPQHLVEMQFAKSLPNHHRVAHCGATAMDIGQQGGEELHVLQAHDRLLLIGETINTAAAMDMSLPTSMMGAVDSAGPGSDLLVTHIALPQQYILSNWPLMHTALSNSGNDIAVAGKRGLAIYSRSADRWRLFGDVSQERQVSCRALCWLDSMVVCCSGPAADGAKGSGTPTGYELLLFPRYHLDLTSLVCRHPLTQPPVAMDCVSNHILIASEPLEIALLEVDLKGTLTPTGNPRAKLSLVREISMLDMGRPLLDMALVPAISWMEQQQQQQQQQGLPKAPVPKQCVLLRWGGLMSVLDLEKGSEIALSTDVECFWLSDSLSCQMPSPSPESSGLGSRQASVPQLSPRPIANLTAAQAAPAPAAVAVAAGIAAATAAAATGAPPGVAAAAAATGIAAGTTAAGLATAPGVPVPAGGVPQKSSELIATGSQSIMAGPSADRLGITDTVVEASTPGIQMDVEMPWWAYGPQGMQLWFPSSLSHPVSPKCSGSNHQDIELEFDQEVYPIGISLADAAIIGVTQRVVRGIGANFAQGAASLQLSAGHFPCFHPIPESQPVLPCLLRRLLQHGAFIEAVSLAKRHECGPHFTRSLEWLLFTTLEMEASKPLTKHKPNDTYQLGRGPMGDAFLSVNNAVSAGGNSFPMQQPVSPLLSSAAGLVRHFPQFADVVVSVARKTDASLWPALFSAIGSPTMLLEGLLEAGALGSAACLLLVIDRLEGASVSHTQALRLIRSSLKRGQYPLVGELLRFIIPPDQGEAACLSPKASTRGGIDEAIDASHLPEVALSPQSSSVRPSASGGRGATPRASAAGEAVPAAMGNGNGMAHTSASGGDVSKPQASMSGALEQGGSAAKSSSTSWLGWIFGMKGGDSNEDAEAEPEDGAAGTAAGAGADAGASTRTSIAGPGADAAARSARNSIAGAQLGPGSVAAAASKRSSMAGTGLQERGLEAIALSPKLLRMHSNLPDTATAPADEARRLVAEHAWQLLEAGRLGALWHLQNAVAFLHGGLVQLMQSHMESAYASKELQNMSALELLSALSLAVQEFPVWNSEDVERQAQEVLRLCKAVGAHVWLVALAVILVDITEVKAFTSKEPQVWADFVAVLKADKTFAYLYDIVDLLSADQSVPAPPTTPRAAQTAADMVQNVALQAVAPPAPAPALPAPAPAAPVQRQVAVSPEISVASLPNSPRP